MSTTASHVMERQSLVAYTAGTAVTLSQPRRNVILRPRGGLARKDEPTAVYVFEAASGVSDDAEALQRMLHRAAPEVDHWQSISSDDAPDLEKEIVVLLPPKSQRQIVVKARYVGRATPLIDPDDIPGVHEEPV